MRIQRDWPEMVRTAREKGRRDPNGPWPDNRKIFKELVVTDTATTWKSFQKWAEGLQDSWALRGHADGAWDLETSLDRATILRYQTKWSSGMQRRADLHEKWLVREFKRRAHQYLSHLPGDDEIIDWLALMQDYGGPTRLLDWTRSPCVALYFAVEKKVSKKPAAVWAIDCDWALKESAKTCDQFDPDLSPDELSAKMSRYVNELLAGKAAIGNPRGVAFPTHPKRVNERMAAQQGLFLCSDQNYPPFDIALLTMIMHDDKPDRPPVRKLIVRPQEQIEFLKQLRRMNITAASLFPGLEGFARSLGEELEIKMYEERIARERSIENKVAQQQG